MTVRAPGPKGPSTNRSAIVASHRRAIFGRCSSSKSSTYGKYACGFDDSAPAKSDPTLRPKSLIYSWTGPDRLVASSAPPLTIPADATADSGTPRPSANAAEAGRSRSTAVPWTTAVFGTESFKRQLRDTVARWNQAGRPVAPPPPAESIAAPCGAVPALNGLCGAKPQPRVALVQGSFHWPHKGHFEMIRSVASDPRFDLVVVFPTPHYDDRKPFIRSSHLQRASMLESGLDDTVDDAQQRRKIVVLRNSSFARPWELVGRLLGEYPRVAFTYCLGADSYNESSNWPYFKDLVEQAGGRLRLMALSRPGFDTDLTGREAYTDVRDGSVTRASGTDVRQARAEMDFGTLAALQPPSVLQALQRPAGCELIEADEPNVVAHHKEAKAPLLTTAKALQHRVEAGGDDRYLPNLLRGIDWQQCDAATRNRLVRLQQRMHNEVLGVSAATFEAAPASEQVDKAAGYSAKTVLRASYADGKHRKYLFKPLGTESEAQKVVYLTVLANLLGVQTPLAVRCEHEGRVGVLLRWVDGLEPLQANRDATGDHGRVHEYVLLCRWLDELVGNQDCWHGQFLHPRGAAEGGSDLVHIDLDEAYRRRSPSWVYDALVHHFGLPEDKVHLEDCRWTDRVFRFSDPVGWDKDHYDSRFSYYGWLLKQYVLGDIDINIDAVKASVREVGHIPPQAVTNAAQAFVTAAGKDYRGFIPLQAVDRGAFSTEELVQAITDRVFANVEPFCDFLDNLRKARTIRSGPLYEHYARMQPRMY